MEPQKTISTPSQPVHPWDLPTPDGGILGAVGGAIMLLLWLRRRVSADNREISKDHAESTFINGLTAELQRSREALEHAFRERNELVAKNAELQSKLTHLEIQRDRHERRIRHLESLLGIPPDQESP